MTKRKSYTAEFKAKVVLELLKEEKTISQLASEHGIHTQMLTKWRNKALEQFPSVFSKQGNEVNKLKKEYDEERDTLYAEIGKLTTQLAWLKKKSGYID